MSIYRGTGSASTTTDQATIDEVTTQATNAANSATEAASSASTAASSASSASSSASTATSQASAASTSASNASASASTASTKAGEASTSAIAASASATTASSHETNAETAKDAAVVAQGLAEDAQTAAETAKGLAEGFKDLAASSASSASSSASTATTKAGEALASANSASDAQTAAEAAQAAAEAAQAAIDGTYLGAQASNPTGDGNGDDVTVGDWYFNTTSNQAYIYNGSTWDALAPDLIGDATPQLGGNLDTNGNDITFGDDDKAIFGAGDDLQIYHDGSNSYIADEGTGALLISGASSVGILNGDRSEYMINTVQNGAVTAYYNGSAKLATTNTGIDVTGTVTADGFLKDNQTANFKIVDFGGSSTEIAVETGGQLNITTEGNNPLQFKTNDAKRAEIEGDGDIIFYASDATTKGFFWDASAEGLNIGASSAPFGKLDISDVGGTGVSTIFDAASGDNYITSGASGIVQFRRGSTNTVKIDGSGNVGIGTTSPTCGLHIDNPSNGAITQILDTDNSAVKLVFRNNTETGNNIQIGADGSNLVAFTGGSEAMRIDSSGNVGIGTSSPDGSSFSASASPVVDVSGTQPLIILSETDSNTKKAWVGLSSDDFFLGGTNTNTRFYTNGSERMRIDSSGKVGIGTTSPTGTVHLSSSAPSFYMTDTTNNTEGVISMDNAGSLVFNADLNSEASGSNIRFAVDGSEAARIDANGNVGIGTTSPGAKLEISDTDGEIRITGTRGTDTTHRIHTGGTNSQALNITSGATSGNAIYHQSSSHIFRSQTGATEYARIDSSGNLLVSTTQPAQAGNTSDAAAGIALLADNSYQQSRSGVNMYLNRLGSDGDIISFRNTGASVGSIASVGGNVGIGNADTGIYFSASNDNIVPCNLSTSPPSNRDNAIDLGALTVRFDDIYATNGTIQTSDRNEKQDIEKLSEAEQRVAVAAKGLLRKFRWIDSVEEKGDDARIHFGIIAQDLQAAFEAEGLDAGRYAMFIHSTWTDEETGEERSRMGVRYSELLAFIIAAI